MTTVTTQDFQGGPLTVLLVEDDAQVRNWIHRELENRGYDLLEAGDGADALIIAELHNGPIHVIVTDVMMPRVNGPELVEALLQARPGVQVLYMSGIPEANLRENAILPAGVNYLQKPFDADHLLMRITQLLADAPRQMAVR